MIQSNRFKNFEKQTQQCDFMKKSELKKLTQEKIAQIEGKAFRQMEI